MTEKHCLARDHSCLISRFTSRTCSSTSAAVKLGSRFQSHRRINASAGCCLSLIKRLRICSSFLSRAIPCLKSPAMAFRSWIQSRRKGQCCDPPKGPKRQALEELTSFEPEQSEHREHLQHNQGLGGPAHHWLLLRIAFRHQLNAPTGQLL